MPTHILVDKKELGRIMDELHELISKSSEITFEPGGASLPQKDSEENVGSGKPTIGNLIMDRVKLEKFTPRQVLEIIAPYYPSKNPRFIDSIRTALRNDRDRFQKTTDGYWMKVKK